MLSIDPAILAALNGDAFHHEWLLELPGNVNLTTHTRDIVLNGKTYVTSGHILKIPPINREKEIKLHGVTITLSAVDGSIEAALAARNMTNEPCALHLVFIDGTDGSIIAGQSMSMYRGKFDSFTVRETETRDEITVKISSAWAKPDKTSGRITNPQDQEELHAGDRFFEFAHEEKEQIGWGGGEA